MLRRHDREVHGAVVEPVPGFIVERLARVSRHQESAERQMVSSEHGRRQILVVLGRHTRKVIGSV